MVFCQERLELLDSLEVDSTALYYGVSEIVNEALDSGAFPGCQILLA